MRIYETLLVPTKESVIQPLQMCCSFSIIAKDQCPAKEFPAVKEELGTVHLVFVF